MAAYSALLSLGRTLDEIKRHPNHVLHRHHASFKPLQEIVVRLQEFMEKFPQGAAALEARIGDSANEAEDLIEYYMSNEARSESGVWWLISGASTAIFGDRLRRLQLEILAVEGKIVFILGEVEKIERTTRIEDVRVNDDDSLTVGRSGENEKLVVGIDEDLQRIKIRLLEERYDLHLVPIVGAGGIGKTTLARTAFDDPLIRRRFDLRAWVTISQNYDARGTLLSLLKSIKASTENRRVEVEAGESMEEEWPQETGNQFLALQVYKILKRRRYLIIVDDIWDANVWDDVKRILPDDCNGSRILLTTRDSNVASYADSSSPIHHMKLMDGATSWNLLEEKVFGKGNCPVELVEIGKTIAENCKGLPLAIVVIAGLLSKVRRRKYYWERIAEDVNSAIRASDAPWLEILSLSYRHLPHYLKPCFLYTGGFPEVYEIGVSNLIKLWVAEGFVKQSTSKTEEDIGYAYLEDLVKRNLISILGRSSNGRIKSCSVHSLLREMSARKAQEEKFLHVIDSDLEVFPEGIIPRRLIFCSSKPGPLTKTYASPVHTALLFQPNNLLIWWLHSFRLLRVLDLLKFYLKMLPPGFLQLFHLRYFAFSYMSERFKFPASLCRHQNLQTLIIHPGDISTYTLLLPIEIWSMPQLRHLIFLGRTVLPIPPPLAGGGTLALNNLQTIRVTNFRCTREVVVMIPNIRKLCIHYSGDISNICLNNLVHLHQLETLRLRLDFDCYGWHKGPLSQNLCLPTSLKKLILTGWGGHISWKDMTDCVGPLPHLEVLKLRHYACFGDEWETNEGGFPQLRMLEISETYLTCWITECSHFPRLEHLVLNFCYNLRELPDCIGDIPTLQTIQVNKHEESIVAWAEEIAEVHRDLGDDLFQVVIDEFIHPPGKRRIAEEFSDEQIANLRKNLFDILEKDGEGRLTRKSLRMVPAAYKENSCEATVQAMVHAIDPHHDGTLDFSGFLKFIIWYTKDRDMEDEHKLLFQYFDKDQDGFLSAEELRDALRNIMDPMIENVAVDGEGRLNYVEFVRMRLQT